jgi:hypothetical protein
VFQQGVKQRALAKNRIGRSGGFGGAAKDHQHAGGALGTAQQGVCAHANDERLVVRVRLADQIPALLGPQYRANPGQVVARAGCDPVGVAPVTVVEPGRSRGVVNVQRFGGERVQQADRPVGLNECRRLVEGVAR